MMRLNLTGYTVHSKQSLKDGYGCRRVVTCARCGERVADVDPGNGAGYRYAVHWVAQAVEAHNQKCVEEAADA